MFAWRLHTDVKHSRRHLSNTTQLNGMFLRSDTHQVSDGRCALVVFGRPWTASRSLSPCGESMYAFMSCRQSLALKAALLLLPHVLEIGARHLDSGLDSGLESFLGIETKT